MFDNKWQRKEMPLVSLIGMGGGIASPAFLASIVLDILKPTVFSPADDTGVADFDYTAKSSAITNIVDILGGGMASATYNFTWFDLVYGAGKFVAVANQGVSGAQDGSNQVMYSTDGINWTATSTPAGGRKSIIYGAPSTGTYAGTDIFVAVGSPSSMYSTDGINWSASNAVGGAWNSVAYGNGTFVAVAWTGGSPDKRVMYSTDGMNWTAVYPPDNNQWKGVTYANGKFVACASSGTYPIMYSSDGINWTRATQPPIQYDWEDIVYGGDKFVCIGFNTNQVIYSSDGINWTAATVPEANYWRAITYGDGKFVAVSSNGTNRVMYSTDGINWTATNGLEDSSWYGIGYGGGKFIAVAEHGDNRVMYSVDGANWTQNFVELTLTDTTVSKASNGSLVEGVSIDQALTVGETVQADTAVAITDTVPVFSADTWTGNGASAVQKVTTGVDMVTTGGMTWTKARNRSSQDFWCSNFIYDSERGFSATNYLRTDSSDPEGGQGSNGQGAIYAEDGYLPGGPGTQNTENYAGWSFRQAPGFFDVVTYTGDGGWDKTISHNLGSVPAFVIIKRTDSSSNWMVGHAFDGGNHWSSISADFAHNALTLNSTDPSTTDSSYVGCKDATSATFTVHQGNSPASNYGPNHNNATYVAYLFANTPGLIKCGTYTGTGSFQTISTGFRPEFVITKSRSHTSDWYLMDYERPDRALYANQPVTEQNVDISYESSGFRVGGANFALNASGYDYIYVAIALDGLANVTSDVYASGTVTASTGNTITLSDVSGTLSNGMKIQGVTTDTKDYPDPIGTQSLSLTSSAPAADSDVSTWSGAVWEIATDENFTQNVQTATAALSATGTQVGPSFALLPNTGYYTRTKYTALGNESEWSDVIHFVTASA